MKALFVSFLFSGISLICYSQGLKKFFAPIPKPASGLPAEAGEEKRWEWRPIVALPAFKITESTRPDTKVDALLLTSTGGGISIQKLAYNQEKKRYESSFSWSPISI